MNWDTVPDARESARLLVAKAELFSAINRRAVGSITLQEMDDAITRLVRQVDALAVERILRRLEGLFS